LDDGMRATRGLSLVRISGALTPSRNSNVDLLAI
jgi:hypothetical protein